MLGWQVAILVFMAVAGLIASASLDLLQSFVPSGIDAFFSSSCSANRHNNLILSGRPYHIDPGTCLWVQIAQPELAPGHVDQWSGQTTISETASGGLRISLTVSVPASDPLVARIREGDATQDPGAMTSILLADITVNGTVPSWTAPTLTTVAGGKVAVGESAALPAASSQDLFFGFVSPGTLRVSTSSLDITMIQGYTRLVSQGAHSLDVDYGHYASLNLSLSAAGAVSPGTSSAASPANFWLTLAPAAWRFLWGFSAVLLPALAWLALFLVGRSGRLGSLGKSEAAQRLLWVTGMVLMAHFAISIATAISSHEDPGGALQVMSSSGATECATLGSTPYCYPAGSPALPVLENLVTRLLGRNVLHPLNATGYPSTAGATVLLIAVVLSASRGWARPAPATVTQKRQRWRAAGLALVAVACAAGLYAWIAANWAFPASTAAWSTAIEVICGAVLGPLVIVAVGSVLLSMAWQRAIRNRPRSGATPQGAAPPAAPSGAAPPGVPDSPASPESQPAAVPRGLRFRPLALVIGVSLVLAISADLTWYSGALPLLLRWAVVIGAGTMMGLAVDRIIRKSTGLSFGGLRFALPAAVVIAIPWGIVHSTTTFVGWWSVMSYAVRLDDLLPLVLIAAAAATFREMGKERVTDAKALSDHRVLGVLTWFVVLSASYTFAGGFSWSALAATAAAGLGAWVLLPSSQVARAAVVLGQSGTQRLAVLRLNLKAGAARRLIPAYSKLVI
jgi:hypothetical protein